MRTVGAPRSRPGSHGACGPAPCRYAPWVPPPEMPPPHTSHEAAGRPRGGRGLRHHPAAQRFLTPASRAGPSSVPLAGVPGAGGTALTSRCAPPPSLSGRPGVPGRSPRSVHVHRRHRYPHRLRRNVGSSHGAGGPGSHAQRPARRPGRGRAGRPPRAHAGPCAPRPARRRRGARPSRAFPASPPPLGLSLPCLFLKKQGGRGDRLPSRPPSR